MSSRRQVSLTNLLTNRVLVDFFILQATTISMRMSSVSFALVRRADDCNFWSRHVESRSGCKSLCRDFMLFRKSYFDVQQRVKGEFADVTAGDDDDGIDLGSRTI